MRRPLLLTCLLLTGCASSYVTPGGPAPLAKLQDTDPAMRDAYAAKPLAGFPAVIAVARLQSSDYRSRTAQTVGHGQYTVVTTRDVEGDLPFDALAQAPGVRSVALIPRMLLPDQGDSESDLRYAAARLKADVLLLYTFDTQFYVRDFAAPVSVITLGLSPNRRAYVSTTASAILIDPRTGYVYGGAEATAKSDQLANGWTSDDAVDDTRLRTERQSFGSLVLGLAQTWDGVQKQYDPAATQPASATRP